MLDTNMLTNESNDHHNPNGIERRAGTLENRLRIEALERDVRALKTKIEVVGTIESRMASMEADLRWLKWFCFAQAGATIGMLFKLFAG